MVQVSPDAPLIFVYSPSAASAAYQAITLPASASPSGSLNAYCTERVSPTAACAVPNAASEAAGAWFSYAKACGSPLMVSSLKVI